MSLKSILEGSFLKDALNIIIAVNKEDVPKNKSEGPPARWEEFLKEKYEGGKKKVPNTNPDTKDKFPQVSMSTLFKNDFQFKSKVMNEYKAWLKDSKQTDLFYDSKPKIQDKPISKNEAKKQPFHNASLEQNISYYLKKFKKKFDSINIPKDLIEKGGLALNKHMEGLSLGDEFLEEVLDEESFNQYTIFFQNWQGTSGSYMSIKMNRVFDSLTL